MFRRFAKFLIDPPTPDSNGPDVLMRLHPADLTALLELAWDQRSNNPDLNLGHPARRSDLPGLEKTWFGATAFSNTPPDPNVKKIAGKIRTLFSGTSVIGRLDRKPAGLFDHLIYAYMIENTRIYEIFRRVIHEFLHGEKLGVPGSAESQRWLRTTEELFYRDPPPFFITAITSQVRADIHGTRRNAYQRMFGMDLNHGMDDSKPYPYLKAEAANNEFVATFEEFLREV